MTSMLRGATVTIITGLLLCGKVYAQDPEALGSSLEPDSPPPIAVVVDLYILRPLGLLRLALGIAAFVPVGLMTAPNGKESLQTALDLFVTYPLKDVFVRKPGRF